MQVGAPIPGRIVSLRQVPDLVFSGMIVGAGVALRPLPGSKEVTAVAPISGRLVKLFPHAFMIASGEQTVLVHLGIDTVRCGGTVLLATPSKMKWLKPESPLPLSRLNKLKRLATRRYARWWYWIQPPLTWKISARKVIRWKSGIYCLKSAPLLPAIPASGDPCTGFPGMINRAEFRLYSMTLIT